METGRLSCISVPNFGVWSAGPLDGQNDRDVYRGSSRPEDPSKSEFLWGTRRGGVDRESESTKTAFPMNIAWMSTRRHRRLRIRIFCTAQKTRKAFPLIAVNHRGSRAFGSAQALRSAFFFVYVLGTIRLIYISFYYFFCLFHRSSRISILMRKNPFGVYGKASIIGPNRGCCKTIAIGNTALKSSSKCSFSIAPFRLSRNQLSPLTHFVYSFLSAVTDRKSAHSLPGGFPSGGPPRIR